MAFKPFYWSDLFSIPRYLVFWQFTSLPIKCTTKWSFLPIEAKFKLRQWKLISFLKSNLNTSATFKSKRTLFLETPFALGIKSPLNLVHLVYFPLSLWLLLRCLWMGDLRVSVSQDHHILPFWLFCFVLFILFDPTPSFLSSVPFLSQTMLDWWLHL